VTGWFNGVLWFFFWQKEGCSGWLREYEREGFLGFSFCVFPRNFSPPLFSKFSSLFFKTSNINVVSTRKINNFKNNALKVERVQKTFEI